MFNRRARFVLILLVLLLLMAWAPWLSTGRAEFRAAQAFADAWEGIIDGCGVICNGCGAKESQRIPFGVTVRLEYACGMIPADTPEYHRQTTVFVSFLGTVHGIRSP